MFDARAKITDAAGAAQAARDAQAKGLKVVFTNGCFDILHAGHARYLGEARALGDLLVVGLNSDASVRTLGKSPERPYNHQDNRAEVLAALAAVDMVVIFEESTPARLIEAIGPDVLVKGGDWPVERIVGADTVRARGGKVLAIPLLEGLSTTGLVERIKANR